MLPLGFYSYFITVFGSIASPFLVISKCKCGWSAISNAAVSPTVPILWPLFTFSPTVTNSVDNKFAYKV